MRKIYYIALLAFAFCFVTCSPDDDSDSIPDRNTLYPVYLQLDRNIGGMDDVLRIPSSIKVITEPRLESDKIGYKGLIIYSNDDHNILVYDLACPNCWNGNILTQSEIFSNYFSCSVCQYLASLENGAGSFPNGKTRVVYLAKYPVKAIDYANVLVSNKK